MPADLSKTFKHKCPSSSSEFPGPCVAGGGDCIRRRLSLRVCPALTLSALASGSCRSLKGELGPELIGGGFSLPPACSAQPAEYPHAFSQHL